MLDVLATQDRATIQTILAWAVCFAAFIWGGAPERTVALIWFICLEVLAGGYFLLGAPSYRYADIDVVIASIDVVAGVAWIAVALNANRNYPMWIAAMQLLSMTAHLARGLAEAISPIAYAFMVVAPGWFQLFFLAAGLIRHIQRQRTYGPYRDWRTGKAAASAGGLAQALIGNPRARMQDSAK